MDSNTILVTTAVVGAVALGGLALTKSDPLPDQCLEKHTQVLKDKIDKRSEYKDLPDNVWIDVYESPRGQGCVVNTETDTHIIRVGYGPDADQYHATDTKVLNRFVP